MAASPVRGLQAAAHLPRLQPPSGPSGGGHRRGRRGGAPRSCRSASRVGGAAVRPSHPFRDLERRARRIRSPSRPRARSRVGFGPPAHLIHRQGRRARRFGLSRWVGGCCSGSRGSARGFGGQAARGGQQGAATRRSQGARQVLRGRAPPAGGRRGGLGGRRLSLAQAAPVRRRRGQHVAPQQLSGVGPSSDSPGRPAVRGGGRQGKGKGARQGAEAGAAAAGARAPAPAEAGASSRGGALRRAPHRSGLRVRPAA